MSAKQVVSGLHQFGHGGVNMFVIDEGEKGLTLIDTGYSKHVESLANDIRALGREPSEVRRILLTHAHPDHLGGAKLMSAGSIPVSINPADEDIARAGTIHQTMKPGPGILNGILFRILIGNKPAEFPAFQPDDSLNDGDVIDVAGGLEVIHTPGHTAGHVSFLWKRDRGLLITGDAAGNLFGLDYMVGYDDITAGRASLAKLAAHDFEVAVFGHGRPIFSGASAKFASKFG